MPTRSATGWVTHGPLAGLTLVSRDKTRGKGAGDFTPKYPGNNQCIVSEDMLNEGIICAGLIDTSKCYPINKS